MSDEFKYDIAFSFLSKDETMAQEINDCLQDRYQTFIYTERQSELAGTDGDESFKRVFSTEARIVAVLFRPEWGTTRWTRVEQTAIRDRALDNGYDFCTFVAMTDPVERPNWLPKNRLLYVAKRFGLQGLAAALEARLQERGGTVSEESVAQRGQRLMRAAEFAEEAERFRLRGGVAGANAAVASLLDGLAQHAKELTEGSRLTFSVETHSAEHVVVSPNAVLAVCWRQTYVNSLIDSELAVGFYDRLPRFYGTLLHLEDARKLESAKFDFKLVGPSRPAWVSGQTEVAPDDMAKHLMMRLMHHDEMELRRKNQRTR
jgi:hypothetical protein